MNKINKKNDKTIFKYENEYNNKNFINDIYIDNKRYKDKIIIYNKIIEKSNYILMTPQEQLQIIRVYATALHDKQNKPEGKISAGDFLLIKKIFDFSDCSKELLDASFEIIEFFKLCGVDLLAFLSYGVNTNDYENTWGNTLLEILKLNDTTNLISKGWVYYRDFYFKPKNKNQTITSFINFLDTYEEYPDLLKNVMENNLLTTTDDEKYLVDALFDLTNRELFHHIKEENNFNQITTIADLKKYLNCVDDIIIDRVLKINGLEKKVLNICYLFFNYTTTLENLIETYGNTERLKLLQFNNRKNPYIVELIENALVMASFIEGILNFKTEQEFNSFVTKLNNNREYLFTIRKMLSKYKNMMIKLYELESNYNLTNVNRAYQDGTVDGERIRKEFALSGINDKKIRVLNLSNCKYSLYAHVVSPKETMDELVHGKDKENQVFISLSPISHRNQVYYKKPTDKIILAYDCIPEGNFILGSNHNISSNYMIRKNSADFNQNVQYKQSGILEASMAIHGKNAETIVLRENLIPCGIIIPGGRCETQEELEYSLKYNLPLIVTQRQETGIRNPKDIKYTTNIHYNSTDNHEYNQELSSIRNKLFDKPTSNRIGVLTDIHAMYEPTLAILEDMRKQGITEIYSLGDNIGFGPNPHEVLELLREYNVKSIYGNHEIYSVDGMDALNDHMNSLSPFAVEKDKKRTEWTRNQLSKQDIEDIMKYDSKIVITKGGKKITLVHSKRKDLYEVEGHFTKPEIDENSIIVEGHDHFESEQKDNLKLRAAGMGFSGNDYGKARYLVIEEDGNFLRINVSYNIKNFKESVNESSMGDEIRSTIDRFTRY